MYLGCVQVCPGLHTIQGGTQRLFRSSSVSGNSIKWKIKWKEKYFHAFYNSQFITASSLVQWDYSINWSARNLLGSLLFFLCIFRVLGWGKCFRKMGFWDKPKLVWNESTNETSTFCENWTSVNILVFRKLFQKNKIKQSEKVPCFWYGTVCIILGWKDCFSKAEDHLATFTKFSILPQVFLI